MKNPRFRLPVETIDIGALTTGETKKVKRYISNHHEREIEIASWQTSCHCISIFPSQLTIGVGKRALVEIEYTPDASDEFAGRLLINSVGLSERAEQVVLMQIKVEILAQDETHGVE